MRMGVLLGAVAWAGCAASTPARRLEAQVAVAAAPDAGITEEGPLGEVWRREVANGLEPGDAARAALAPLSGMQVLFVGGFLNEAISGYFDDNAAEVKALGARAWMLAPESTKSMMEDAEFIALKAKDHFARDGRPVILFGHSKGGAGVLLAVLRHPELIASGAVDSVIVVQGAVGGSPVASAVWSPLPAGAGGGDAAGLRSLTSGEARGAFDAALRGLAAEARPRLSDRVFYVRSRMSPDAVAPILKVTAGWLAKQGTQGSDGLLLVEDMLLPDLGRDLGIVIADHAGLTVSGPLSATTALERRAVTRAILLEVSRRRGPGAGP